MTRNWHEPPPSPEEVTEFMNNLRFDLNAEVDETTLPPPGAPMYVVRPVRLLFESDERLQALATGRGLKPSELASQCVETAIQALDQSNPHGS